MKNPEEGPSCSQLLEEKPETQCKSNESLAAASRNLTETLKRLSCQHARDNFNNNMLHHGNGVYSALFSGNFSVFFVSEVNGWKCELFCILKEHWTKKTT